MANGYELQFNSRMPKNIDWKLLLALIIAISPVLGYSLAYVYQLGYCSVFNIPTDLIKLDLTTVLMAIAGTLGVLFFFSGFIFMILSIPRNISTIRRNILFSLVLLFFLFIFSLLFFTTSEAEQVAIMYGIFLLFIFLGPSVARKISGIKWGKVKNESDKASADRVSQIINTKYFKYSMLGVILLVMVIYCGALAGRSDGMNKQIFYVPSSNPNSVVLKIYGDNMICTSLTYSQNKPVLGPTIFVMPLNNSPDIALSPIRIYPNFTELPK